MGLIELALVFSVVIALYNLQQIKITLKDNGYDVSMISGIAKDYKNFKALASEEPDEGKRIKYQQHLNGLHFSLAGAAVILFLIFRDKF